VVAGNIVVGPRSINTGQMYALYYARGRGERRQMYAVTKV
jgi:hypothetical protein